MIQLLLDNPLLLLFVIAAIGYPLGRIKIAGSSLGVAAVLFVGLAFGSLHPEMKLPEILYLLGLVLFVYTIGLSSGPGFFASLRRKGLRDNGLVVATLLLATALTVWVQWLLHLEPTITAGLFAGSLTNTPALAAVLDLLKGRAAGAALDQLLAEPVVGYSIAYPVGVVGMLLAIGITRRLWRVDFAREAAAHRDLGAGTSQLHNRTILVTRPEAARAPVGRLVGEAGWKVVFGRVRRGGQVTLVGAETVLAPGDLVSAVGDLSDLERVTAFLGETSERQITLDRTEYDYRRIFVSNPRVAGHRLRDLNVQQQFGAIVTRVRRGDVELLPHGDTVLELGDRVRVVTQRDHMAAVSAFFGDSYRALSEVDVLTFSLGLALGLLLGFVPFPLPGGLDFRLGFAGGPLIVALVLGALGRTGPLVWSLPYSANLTLRQVGLVLFLAGIGTRAGYAFVATFQQAGGLSLFLAGALITVTTALALLWVGYHLFKIPFGLLIGILAGLQTQPAVLGFALSEAENDLPNIGYATVFPVATIVKILVAQLLLTLPG